MEQRQIKFRAWDIHGKRMITDALELQKAVISKRAALDLTDEVIWEQFTGLKDKNGKDVYEGDVIESIQYKDCIVVYNQSVCSFQFAYKGIGAGTSFGKRITNTLYDFETSINFEIIGNIHETP